MLCFQICHYYFMILFYLGQVLGGRFEEALSSLDLSSISAQSNFFIDNIGSEHKKEMKSCYRFIMFSKF